MMKISNVMAAAAVAALGFAASAANAATIVNGSFETGPAVGGEGFTTLSSGDTSITGWTVGGAGVDYIGSYWQAEDGSHSLDVSATDAGSISQTFATNAGTAYTISFWMAGNPAGGDAVKSLDVLATGGSTQNYTFDTSGHSLGSMGWTHDVYHFVASGSSTTLTFTSLSANPYGPALDNVSISSAPEPASWALMISGLGLTGFALRRRTAKAIA